MAKRLYLMRHGQTLYNVQKLVQGRCDSPLTSTGIEQAREASEWLARQGVSFGRICSSPLGRAYNTACIAREALQKREDARNVLAVSHGSATLQFKLAWEHAARCDQGQPLGNCCILVFDYDEEAGSFSNTEIVNLPA